MIRLLVDKYILMADLNFAVYYAIYGIRSNKNRQDAILRNLPYLGIAAVGIGSTLFHATLKNYTQWCTSPFSPASNPPSESVEKDEHEAHG